MTTPSDTTSPAMQRILALLARKSDMSASDMSREAFVGVTTLACGGYLKALRAKKLVHVSGWRKTRKGFVTPLFSLGDHPDLPRPRFDDEDRDSAGLGQIVEALQRFGAMTYVEVAQVTGLSPNTSRTPATWTSSSSRSASTSPPGAATAPARWSPCIPPGLPSRQRSRPPFRTPRNAGAVAKRAGRWVTIAASRRSWRGSELRPPGFGAARSGGSQSPG